MMIVLQYHGVVLGPRLFIDSPQLAYGVFVAMVVAYVFMILTILPLARYMSRVTLVPTSYLVPIIVACTIVGAFADREYVFDMGLALAFGVLGYVGRKTGYHVTALLIGVIIGPLFEQYLVRALRISQGDLSIFFTSTIGNVLWALLAISVVLPLVRGRAKRVSEEPTG
jgi:putative tricarboxylic transport membrane protein